jgi:hypothetical protein
MSKLDYLPAPILSSIRKFADKRGRRPLNLEELLLVWRTRIQRREKRLVHLVRQPRYPRRQLTFCVRRPVALRPCLSAGLPNAPDYAQRSKV